MSVRAQLLLPLALAFGCAIGAAQPPAPGPTGHEVRFSLLALGDTGRPVRLTRLFHGQRAVARGLTAEDRRLPADALLLLGDNFYYRGLESKRLVERLRQNLVGPYCRFVELSGPRSAELDGACGLPSGKRHPIPIYALLGNHDYDSPESVALQRSEVPRFVPNWHVPAGLAETVEFAPGVSLVLLDSMALRAGADPQPLV